MLEISYRSLVSGFLFATEIADPTLPLIIIGCIIVAVVAFAIYRSGRQERKLKKNILPDATLEFESEIGRQKRELAGYFEEERYNYASGFIPGAEPELSFIDPARRGEPIEVITARETYHPTAEPLAERPVTATDRTYPTRVGAKMSTPFKMPESAPIAPPVLEAEIDAASIERPNVTPVPSVSSMPVAEPKKPTAPEKARRDKRIDKEHKPTRAEKRAARVASATVVSDAPSVTAAAIKDAAPKAPSVDVNAPKIALAPSVKKVERSNGTPKDTHRVVITAVPVAHPKPPRKDTRNEFKVSVEKTEVEAN
ncbi:MAG: hypothetical protein IKV20_01545 [Clostridia bacterium]|nr:hypothetical protein [Clostridia bacterium]